MIEEKKQKKELSSFATFLIYLGIGLVVAMGVKMLVEPTLVVGESMEPNLHSGEYMVNLKTAYSKGEPKRGDIVIVEPHDDSIGVQFMIKRVVGLPGDVIKIVDNQVYLNGDPLDEPYILEEMTSTEDMTTIINEDEVFVMGDNRNNSLDSRDFGAMSIKKQIRGKVIFRVYPTNQSYKDIEIAQ